MTEEELRGEIVDAARAMNRRGLNRGTSGNISARVPDGMLVTPSAVPYHAMTADQVVRMTLDGEARGGVGRPSTEWRLHAAVLAARPDIDSVLHAHPEFCTTLACLRRGIPAVHYMVAVAGGAVRCAPYAPFGTPELAGLAVTALEGRTACLLANHGLVALGASPAAALELALEVEGLAAVYWRALAVGEPVALSDAEMADVLERIEDYRSGAPE